MFSQWLGKTKKFIITLRFSILSIFILLFAVTLITLLSIFYFHLSEIVLQAALLLMEKTSYTILYDLDNQLRPAEDASNFSANNIREKIIDVTSESEISIYLIHLLEHLPLADGIYWADVNGSFIYMHKLEDGRFIGEYINRNTTPPKALQIIFDNQHNIISRAGIQTQYDPRTSVWYQTAIKARRTIWTDAYVFKHGAKGMGTTVATPAFESDNKVIGVFGVDVRLDSLQDFISQRKVGTHGEIYILDKDDDVIASSVPLQKTNDIKIANINKISRPWVKAAVDQFLKERVQVFEFQNNNKNYLAAFSLIPILHDQRWAIVLIDDASDFTRPIHVLELVYILVILGIFLFGIMIMSYLITRIVTPIKILVEETERIKNFVLTGSRRVQSRIKEVIELSEAIFSMKMGLRSFQKYVPAGLVRQLIHAGEDAEISGSKREVAIFFSDIKGFTAITEKEESNQLVKQLCDYYEILSKNIILNKGTIDKYIGDSIMAFWGAPLSTEQPCHKAANAVLECAEQVFQINAIWRNEGWPIFLTNYGLHYGEAIVGSLGSSERLNYTAFGDAVNIASRLVNVNKIYGTTILVSEAFFQQIKNDFVLRLVDKVTLKGKASATAIYELMAQTKDKILFDIDRYREQFLHAFNLYQQQKWEDAITSFKTCLEIYPQDTLAPVFIRRCENFIKNPPQSFQGIWPLSEK